MDREELLNDLIHTGVSQLMEDGETTTKTGDDLFLEDILKHYASEIVEVITNTGTFSADAVRDLAERKVRESYTGAPF